MKKIFGLFGCILTFLLGSCSSYLNSNANPENYFSGAYLPIGQAIHKGNSNDIKKLLKQQQLHIDTIGEGGKYGKPTFLMYAVMIEKPEMVKILLELDADPTLTNLLSFDNMISRDRDGNIIKYDRNNALDWASTQIKNIDKAKKIIKLLVDHGADINAFGDYYYAPLQNAFMSHDGKDTKELVDFLLANGADINASLDKGGDLAIILPFTTGQWDMIDYLLDKGADPTKINFAGWDLMWEIQDGIENLDQKERPFFEKLKNRLINEYGMQYPPVQQKERGKELQDSMYKVMGIKPYQENKKQDIE